MRDRLAGVLMPVSSLPSRYGIGDFGKEAFEFIDIIYKGGFRIWQILPLNPLGYGNSPYQPYSSKAMDSLYISLDFLKEENLLGSIKPFNKGKNRVDYEAVRTFKDPYIREAFNNFKSNKAYKIFISQKWVKDYSKFIGLKILNNNRAWNEWDNYNISEKEVNYQAFIQYILYKQWMKVKDYANKKGILIMGDMPIYVGYDSEDVYNNKKVFLLDSENSMTHVAGVPPDYFSPSGQRWGNPLYDWDFLKATNFDFWVDRLAYNSTLFDIIRIDHFRAFDTYWKIPAQNETAIEGTWEFAYGYDLFDEIFRRLPTINIVAEDLGLLREEVYHLRDHYNFKGMRIVQFSLDLKENIDSENLIIYTGTHDNQTIRSWVKSLDIKTKKDLKKYFENHKIAYEDICLNMVAYTLSSRADIAIIPIMDLLSLDDKARINTPGVLQESNWQFKLTDFKKFKDRLLIFKKMNKRYDRI